MRIGYARVSTQEQTLNLQKDALAKEGCAKIFTDTISGTKTERPGLAQALAYVRPGDTLVVWRLDRLGRSLKHLIETITTLHDRQIGFKSITENIDTTTSGGKLIFHIFGALAEFERDIIKERTLAGLLAARARGRTGGRPKTLSPKQQEMLQVLYSDKSNSITDICKTLNISRMTFYRYIKAGARARDNSQPRNSTTVESGGVSTGDDILVEERNP
jgi:DNA invertase Pin-like site-specific DNA recombinase